jgi:hypothetical protein
LLENFSFLETLGVELGGCCVELLLEGLNFGFLVLGGLGEIVYLI